MLPVFKRLWEGGRRSMPCNISAGLLQDWSSPTTAKKCSHTTPVLVSFVSTLISSCCWPPTKTSGTRPGWTEPLLVQPPDCGKSFPFHILADQNLETFKSPLKLTSFHSVFLILIFFSSWCSETIFSCCLHFDPLILSLCLWTCVNLWSTCSCL